MSILIYMNKPPQTITIGSSGQQKKIGGPCICFAEVPRGAFTVGITDAELVRKIGSMAHMDMRDDNRILMGVDNCDPTRIGMDIAYVDRRSGTVKSCLISHVGCPQESDYELANKLWEVIEEAFHAQKKTSLADVISAAQQQSGAGKNNGVDWTSPGQVILQ